METDALLILALAALAARPRQGRPLGPRPRPPALRLRPRRLARPRARPPAAAVPAPPRRLRAAGRRPRPPPRPAARPAALRRPRRRRLRRARRLLRDRRRLAPPAGAMSRRPPELGRPRPLARHLPRPALAHRPARALLPRHRRPGRSRLRHRRPRRQPHPRAPRAPAPGWSRSSRSGSSSPSSRRDLPPAVTLLPLAAGRAPGRAALAVSRLHPTVSSLARGFAERMRAAPGFAGVRWDAEETGRGHHPRRAHRRPRPAALRQDRRRGLRGRGAGRPRPAGALGRLRVPARRRRETTAACIERLAALGPYEFNLVPGEGRRFALAAWRDAAAIGPALARRGARRPLGRRLRPPARRCLSPAALWRSRVRRRSSSTSSWRCRPPRRARPGGAPRASRSSFRSAILLLLAFPGRADARRAHPFLIATTVLKLADLGTETAFRRPFNPVLDADLVPAAWRLTARLARLARRAGRRRSRSLAALALAALAVWWATGRIARLAPARGRPALARSPLAAAALVAARAASRRPARRRRHRPARLGAPPRRPARAGRPRALPRRGRGRPLRRPAAGRHPAGAARRRRLRRLRRILRPLGAGEPALRRHRQRGARRRASAASPPPASPRARAT